MKWRKLGQLFCPDHQYPWMVSHATNPVAEHLQDGVHRIYFSCRDAEQRSSIASVNLDLPSLKISDIAETPLLSPGPPGAFDDSGASVACLLHVNGEIFLYYVGWNLGVTVPWRNSIGLAVFDPATGKYKKYSAAPLLDRNAADPFSLSYPFVLQEGTVYRMWYGSNLNWGKNSEDMGHVIKYAESTDAIHWDRNGTIAIDFNNASEYAISRPSVLVEDHTYKMWYSYRGITYRIGYAESSDGIIWQRKDNLAGIEPSISGWDSEMIEYPFVFRHDQSTYMLYNGNGYGKTGFGLAILES